MYIHVGLGLVLYGADAATAQTAFPEERRQKAGGQSYRYEAAGFGMGLRRVLRPRPQCGVSPLLHPLR